MKFYRYSMIAKLTVVLCAGILVAACANTMEGVGKDLQQMGNSMGGSQAPANGAGSQTQGKDVTVTPVK